MECVPSTGVLSSDSGMGVGERVGQYSVFYFRITELNDLIKAGLQSFKRKTYGQRAGNVFLKFR